MNRTPIAHHPPGFQEQVLAVQQYHPIWKLGTFFSVLTLAHLTQLPLRRCSLLPREEDVNPELEQLSTTMCSGYYFIDIVGLSGT